MKKIIVQIKGLTPLLMHSPKAMIDALTESKTVQKTEVYDIKKDAEKGAYRKKSRELYVPNTAIKGCIVGAAAYKKFGKYAARPIIAGGVFIPEEEIGLGTKTYEIDLRTVVIQRARVVKARPKLINWTLNFELLYNENLIADHNEIRKVLIDAGQRVGLLDFRPQKLGSFGMFEVTKWQSVA